MNTLNKSITVFLACFSFIALHAQDILTVNTQVTPPYDGNFVNFQTKVILTIHNTTPRAVSYSLEGSLKGSTGITVEFRPAPDPSFTVGGNGTLPLTGSVLQPYFLEQNVGVTGITKDELYRGAGLPPGNYQLCFRAKDPGSGSYFSPAAPLGCFSFTVQQPQPGPGPGPGPAPRPEDAVSLTTQVIPPYSTYLDDYINQNKLLVILQNRSGNNQQLRLTGTIKGNNGVLITIPETFIPSKPIQLLSRQVLQLSGNDLREYFSESTVTIEGISRDALTKGNGLPEGNYQFCLYALDFDTGQPRSPGSPAGCSIFDIRQYEPPMIIQPACNANVIPTQPQNLLFTWSVPAGARPDQVEYILKIVEMYPQDIDPNQAMQAANVPPLFEKVIRTNTYVYSLADPKLEPGKRYAFRVTARTNQTSRQARRSPLNFRNNGHSQVCSFKFDFIDARIIEHSLPAANKPGGISILLNPQDVPPPPPPQNDAQPDAADSPACVAACNEPASANTSSKNISAGDNVKIGKFMMTVTSGNNASGTGTIMVNFLKTPLNVQWANLQVNTDNQVFGNNSKVIAVTDIASLINHAVVTQPTQNPNLSSDQISAIHQLVQQPSRKVSQFPLNNTQPTGLPVALDYGNIDLIVMGIVFTPTNASLNAISLIPHPQSTQDNDLMMLSSSICTRPNGFGESGTVKLMQSNSVAIDKIVIQYEGLETKATFDCSGIQEVTLKGKVEFDRTAVLPVNNNGAVIPGDVKVSAAFNTTVSNPTSWTFDDNQLSHSFTVPSLVGFKMTASQITIDQSDQSSPQGQSATWKGVHMGSVQISLNGPFKKNNGPALFNTTNFKIDAQGLDGNINPPSPALLLTEGTIGSWPVSINNFSIVINNSGITSSNINGKLKLPIAANELNYTVTLVGSQSENASADFQFNVQQASQLNADIWRATLQLEETSTIGIQKIGDNYKPTADLTGTIEINWGENNSPGNNGVGSFDMPALAFEHLTIADNGNNIPDVNMQMAQLVNANGVSIKLATFTAHCTPPGFVKNGNKIGLQFNLDVELIQTANSLSGGTTFTIFAEYQDNAFQYKETQLNKISLNGDVGVAKMSGQIDIYSKHATFGNGFRGQIDVIINALGGAGVNSVLQVGRVNNFNYWYFDVMANLGVAGINIPGTMVSLYGLGGGAYYNMTRGETPTQPIGELNTVPAYSHTPGANKDGLVFTPQQGTYGFSASVALGLSGAPAAFNGDLKFSMQVLASGAVSHVTFEGNAYVMQDITDRDGGIITGWVYAEIQPRIPNASDEINAAQNRPNFAFNSGVNMNIANIIQGSSSIDLWFSPSEWWIKFGQWVNEDYPWQDNNRIDLTVNLKIIQAHFHGYFMMGSNIPGMPQMPLPVREMFAEKNVTLNPSPRLGLLTTSNPNAVPNNPGMAFGAGSYFGADMKFLIFYADLEFIKGFDVVLKKISNSSCGPKIGINGWYAQGQAYFSIDFEVGVELNLWVWKGKASIMGAEAAAAVQAALPNPTWLKGQFAFNGEVLNGIFKFNTSFRFELGEKCDLGTSTPFDEMPIVSDITPDKNEQGVSVYIVPETAFNFPKGNFSYDEVVNGELVTKTYKYIFKTFTLSYKDPKTNQNKNIDLKPHMTYRPGNLSATYYYPDMMLPENTNVTYTIYVEGWQMAPGPAKKVYDESHTGTFKSGSWPTHIQPEQLVQGNPQWRQNFFTKNDGPGFLEFKNPHPHFTDKAWWYSNAFKLGTYSGLGSGNFTFVARFKELATNQVYETTYSMETNKKMVFAIPAGLKKREIYQLELAVRFTPPINTIVWGGTPGNVQQTYEDILITGQQGGGGMLAVQALAMQNQNPGGTTASVAGTTQTQQAQANTVSQYQQTDWQMMNTTGNQQVIQNNYAALATVNPALSPQGFKATNVPPPTNPTFNASMNLATHGQGTYIQRRKSELLNKKAGEQGIEWPLFDNLQWFFRTSNFNSLQAKLDHLKEVGIAYHEYITIHPKFNQGDFVVNPPFSENNQFNIKTKVPVLLFEIEETFEKPYEMGGYTITIANNQNETISVPAKVEIAHTYDDDWYSKGFFHGPDNPYNIPDDDDWAKLSFYDDDDGIKLGFYGQLNIPYPGQWWSNFIPGVDGDQPWLPNRHAGKNPFGNQSYSTPYQIMSAFHTPLKVFFKNSATHQNIDFGNKGVTWFKTTLLHADDIVNAINKGKQAQPNAGGGGANPWTAGLNLQTTYGVQVNPAIPAIPQQYASESKQHLAIIDYTEWATMRDFYLLQKYVYERNENEGGSFFMECSASINKPNPHNCFYPSIKNWINNCWYYTPRPVGQYSFRLGNSKTFRDIYYTLNTVLNPQN